VLPWSLAIHAADSQLLSDHSHLLQVAEDIPGHSLGQINEAVIVADIDVPDVAPLEASLVGDCADDVARLHAVGVAYFETEGFEYDIVVVIALAASGLTAAVAAAVSRTVLSTGGAVIGKLPQAISVSLRLAIADTTLVVVSNERTALIGTPQLSGGGGELR
jgi:hypothetical protein